MQTKRYTASNDDMQNHNAGVLAPLAGHVASLSGSTASRSAKVPVEMQGGYIFLKSVNDYCDGHFSDSVSTVTYGQLSTIAADGTITMVSGSGFSLSPGETLQVFVPIADVGGFVYVNYVQAGLSGTLASRLQLASADYYRAMVGI